MRFYEKLDFIIKTGHCSRFRLDCPARVNIKKNNSLAMVTEQKTADVSFDSLLRIFTVPEGPDSTLTQIEDKLSRNLNQFLREHIVAEE